MDQEQLDEFFDWVQENLNADIDAMDPDWEEKSIRLGNTLDFVIKAVREYRKTI